ncbi:carbohydrate ABC transporter permease [Paenibacillus graminis]|uniref:carbohydrate ABC transporter permease n=1 Tax=Paenibacillus graminis TaxID=189425 RepID=UPI000471C712|nr:sugar ABC transporter permease [Paenibacillus graminis]
MSKDVSRRISRQTWGEWSWGWFLIAPTMIGLIVLNIIPIIQSAYLSFFKSGDFGRGNIFVGLDNYRKMFDDVQVWHAVGNTLLYTVLVVPISIALSLIVAVLAVVQMNKRWLW